ncbi:MAG: HEAT repeat domain-containing protein [Phycisphaerae bacterium]|nr:HEAT repeat domain-containing protein [Phycisphaerae bacterium]
MLNSGSLTRTAILALLTCGVVFGQSLEDNWGSFLHYTAISRFDLAKGHGEQIVAMQPDPTALLDLAEANPEGYQLLLRMHADSDELRQISGQVLDLIEQGRFIRRTDPKIISQEIQRLSTTIRGRIAAEERLRNAGEYAIPYMLAALADSDRKNEFAFVTDALPKIGPGAIRPLTAALQMDDSAVKAEVIRALGRIGTMEPLPHLKYVLENDRSQTCRELAESAIRQIDSGTLQVPSAELFFRLGEAYYNKHDVLAPPAELDFANVWFWDADAQALVREDVSKAYFNELMTMRCCEWALKADAGLGKSIGLWIAAFFRAESAEMAMPEYFGAGHADAHTYATTAGPEYLHQALERALKDKDAYVALGTVEALAVNAGEKSLLYRIGTSQPLAEALSFEDRKVRYSAAIAFAEAGPVTEFVGSNLIIEHLMAALNQEGADQIGSELAQDYAMRAVQAVYQLALTRNRVVDLSLAQAALIRATERAWPQMQMPAGQTLAHLSSPDAQRALWAMAMNEANGLDVRLSAFASLTLSAKLNANLLLSGQIDGLYALISSTEADPQLRAGAAGAFGALNLPSERVKTLILDQSKS